VPKAPSGPIGPSGRDHLPYLTVRGGIQPERAVVSADVYLAMLALAAWSAGAVLWQADVAAFGALFSARTPVRGIAVHMWTAVALNAAAWLARIIPAVAGGGVPGYLRGTGLTVNVVYVQDLALWLPLLAVAAAWLWRRSPWGYLLAGAGLVMWVLESTSIAVDQWYGHAAARRPRSPSARSSSRASAPPRSCSPGGGSDPGG
jgi:hypothetical protein